MIRSLLRLLCKLVIKIFYTVRIVNKNELKKIEKPTIFIANHVSFIDAILFYTIMPKDTFYVIHSQYVKKLNWIFKYACEFVSINQKNAYSMKNIIKKLNEKKHVFIFPEGRLTTTGITMKGYSGIVWIAAKSNAKILPIGTFGLEHSRFTFIKNKYKTFWFHEITLCIGKAFNLSFKENVIINSYKRIYADKIISILQELKAKACMYQNRNINNLFNKLLDSADKHGWDKHIIYDNNEIKLSYKGVVIATNILGKVFKNILQNERYIGIMLPNILSIIPTLFGLFSINKNIVMINYTLGLTNNLLCIATTQVKTIITSRTFIKKANLESLEEKLQEKCHLIYLEDISKRINILDKFIGWIKTVLLFKAKNNTDQEIILFTSGTESIPKGVVLTHKSILANICQGISVFDITPADFMFNALPLFHAFGLMAGAILPLIEGIPLLLYPSPLHYKEIPEICYDFNITILLSTPTFLNGYANYAHHYDFNSIRYVVSGGEKLTDFTRNQWLEKFSIMVMEGYGVTEASPFLSISSKLFHKKGCVGKILPGIEYIIEPIEGLNYKENTKVGLLKVKGPNVMKGYIVHGKGFIPLENNYHDTGDVISIDEEDYIKIVSRLKRFAKISGEMISLDMVEKNISICLNKVKCAAINVYDEKRGEKIIVFIALLHIDLKSLRKCWYATGQTMLAYPEEVILVDNLPLLGNGKTDYIALKGLYERKKKEE